jgi:predicted transcriptional regulator
MKIVVAAAPRRFALGRIVSTPGALEACSAEYLAQRLSRHGRGDWGVVWHKGERLRRARIERGLTLSEEAAILRVDPVVLNDIEHGRRSVEAEELNNRLLEELLQWPTIARDAGGR